MATEQITRPANRLKARKPEHYDRRGWLGAGPIVLCIVSVVAATLMIVRTYSVFDQTYDEAAHIACGMEWLDHGTYTYEQLHPPLARVAAALLPYLAGVRDRNVPEINADGSAILDWNHQYERNLTLARLGMLPFFWLSCLLLWRFMATQFSQWHAALTVIFFAFCPVVLAHSSLATTDAPLMSTFLWAVMALWSWLRQPSWTHAAMAGVAVGLALLSKFTAIPYLALTGGALLLFVWARGRKFPLRWREIGVAAVLVALTIWAGYRFQHGSILATSNPLFAAEERGSLSGDIYNAVTKLNWVPANEFFHGMRAAYLQGNEGRLSYLLGHVYKGGRRAFFPVAFLVKTPIPLLLLFAAGLVWIAYTRAWKRNPATIVPLAGFAGPMSFALTAHMNLGLRHVIPIYPFAAILGAIGAVELWRVPAQSTLRTAARCALVLLLAWNIETCVAAVPDFLAYFNEAARPRASFYLVDSDLDWGQDVKRLSNKLNELHVQQVSLDLMTTRNLDEAHLPPFRRLTPGDRPTGWVAIGEYRLKTRGGYDWLDPYPYTLVGRSIRLYYIPAPPHAGAQLQPPGTR